jgi:hypothetical protein
MGATVILLSRRRFLLFCTIVFLGGVSILLQQLLRSVVFRRLLQFLYRGISFFLEALEVFLGVRGAVVVPGCEQISYEIKPTISISCILLRRDVY